MRLYEFFLELRRRRVFRASAMYIIACWLLLQVASVFFPAFGMSQDAMRLLIQATVLIFPILVFLAWRFDIKGGHLVRAVEAPSHKERSSPLALTRIDYALIFLFVSIGLAVVFDAVQNATQISPQEEIVNPAAQFPERSIAIMPFVNQNPTEGDEYLGESLAEDPIADLARNSIVHVAARTSSFSIKNMDLPIYEMANRLRVRTILEGVLRTTGSRVVVSLELIDAGNGYQIWNEEISGEIDEIQSIKRQILANVTQALGNDPSGVTGAAQLDSEPLTENGEAYQYYLQGKYYWNHRGEDNIRRSIDLFSTAIELDPNFARAHASLALALITLPEYSNEPVVSSYERARQSAQESLRLDSTIAAAHSVIAVINHWNWDWVGAESEFQTAVETEPGDPTSLIWYAELLIELGRLNDSEKLLRKALSVDPVSPPVNFLLGWLYMSKGQNEDALHYAGLSVDYGQPYGHAVQAIVHLRERRAEEARLAKTKLSQALGLDEDLGDVVVDAVLDKSMIANAVSIIDAERNKGGIAANSVFYNYYVLQTDRLLMEKYDDLYRLIEDLIDQNIVRVRVLWLPEAKPVRQDPKMQFFAHKIGLVAAWQEHGPPDGCALLNAQLSCQ